MLSLWLSGMGRHKVFPKNALSLQPPPTFRYSCTRFLQLWRKMKFPLSIDKVWVQEYNGGIRIDDKVPKLQCLDYWLLFEDLIFLNKFNTKN